MREAHPVVETVASYIYKGSYLRRLCAFKVYKILPSPHILLNIKVCPSRTNSDRYSGPK